MRFNDTQTRTLLSVVAGSRTVQEVADDIGRVKSTAHLALLKLADEGLVHYGDGTRRTVVPLVRPVPVEAILRHPSCFRRVPDPAA